MDAYTSQSSGVFLSNDAPVLIAGDSDTALRRAATTVEALGSRIGARVRLETAAERFRIQARASVLWVELERDGGAAMDDLLEQVSSDVANRKCTAVVAAPRDMVDLIFAKAAGHGVELVVEGTEADRVAAMAIALSGAHQIAAVRDMASDQSAERLRQLLVGRLEGRVEAFTRRPRELSLTVPRKVAMAPARSSSTSATTAPRSIGSSVSRKAPPETGGMSATSSPSRSACSGTT